MELKSLVDQPNKLPTVPKIVQQLIESFNAEGIATDDIVRLLEADPVLSAKLLRLANSAYFHVSRTIGTVDDALRMLGFVMVRNLVLSNGMVAAFRHTGGMDLQSFWRYSLYTACAARWLAGQDATKKHSDVAFTLGMLHGIGQLQMHAVIPEQVAVLDEQMDVLAEGRAALEQTSLGFNHADVSAELAILWHFPGALVEALRAVPDPLALAEFNPAAALVHLGAWHARAELLRMTDQERAERYPFPLSRRLGIDAERLSAMPPLQDLSEGLTAMLA